jgi:hypothetical protein
MDISTHIRWYKTAILLNYHELLSLYGREDINQRLTQTVDCHQVIPSLAANMHASVDFFFGDSVSPSIKMDQSMSQQKMFITFI